MIQRWSWGLVYGKFEFVSWIYLTWRWQGALGRYIDKVNNKLFVGFWILPPPFIVLRAPITTAGESSANKREKTYSHQWTGRWSKLFMWVCTWYPWVCCWEDCQWARAAFEAAWIRGSSLSCSGTFWGIGTLVLLTLDVSPQLAVLDLCR